MLNSSLKSEFIGVAALHLPGGDNQFPRGRIAGLLRLRLPEFEIERAVQLAKAAIARGGARPNASFSEGGVRHTGMLAETPCTGLAKLEAWVPIPYPGRLSAATPGLLRCLNIESVEGLRG